MMTTSPPERILEAAAEVFAAEGFAGARVDEIARRAGVNKAMLYYHVGDKAALYEAVLVRNFDRVLAVLEASVPPGERPEAQLRSVIETVVAQAWQVPHHPRIMLREMASGGANLTPPVIERVVRVLALVRSIVERGRSEGCFRDVDPVLTHLMVVGSLMVMSLARPVRSRVEQAGIAITAPDDPAALARFVADTLLHGIVSTPQGGSR